ncbi:hypothetical protein [Sorangium sp. So ce1182]
MVERESHDWNGAEHVERVSSGHLSGRLALAPRGSDRYEPR